MLYVFVPDTQKWDKCNVEGTLFVCGLAEDPEVPGAQRFVAIILNRRGLENFATLLEKSQGVEVTEEYVILQVHGDLAQGAEDEEEEEAQPGVKIYGLWIFSEAGTSTAATRIQVAAVIKECAATAETSRIAAEGSYATSRSGGSQLPPSPRRTCVSTDGQTIESSRAVRSTA